MSTSGGKTPGPGHTDSGKKAAAEEEVGGRPSGSAVAQRSAAARQIQRSLKAWRSDESAPDADASAEPAAEESAQQAAGEEDQAKEQEDDTLVHAKVSGAAARKLLRKSAIDDADSKVFRAKAPRDPATPRKDERPVPTAVATQQGAEIEIAPGALDHVLKGHTVENFDPTARLGEVGPGVATSLFPPGFATNAQEIVTVVKQALGNKAAKNFDPTQKRQIEVTLKNLKLQIWVGPVGKSKPGAYMLNSCFPVGGVSLSFAEVKAFADAIKAKTKTLQQVRTELVGRFGK